MHGVEKQIIALRRGIFEVVPKFLLEAFNEREFEVCHLIMNVYSLIFYFAEIAPIN